MSKIIKITAFFLFFVVGFCVQNVSAALELNPDLNLQLTEKICLLGQKCCNIDGVDTCVEDTGQICLACGGLNKVETCTKGATETVHTAVGCTYTTKERKCCDGLSWVEGECCSGDTPESSKTCVNAAGYTGTQSRTVSCDYTTGEWDIGTWSSCSATRECDPGAVRTGSEGYCNNNKFHQQVCDSNGKWGTCGCINQPDKYYKNMPYPVGAYVVNGYWSEEACYGSCCCNGDYPVMITASAGTYKGLKVPQCEGKNDHGVTTWQYTCACIGTTVDKEGGTNDYNMPTF